MGIFRDSGGDWRMNIEIRKYGNSLIIVLPPPFAKFHDLKVGDWVDIDDIVKSKKSAENRLNSLKTASKKQNAKKGGKSK